MSQSNIEKGNIYDTNAMTDKQGKIQTQNSQIYIGPQESPTLISENYRFDGFNIPRIPCLYHKGNILTNFCSCIECLLPLCPQCVEEHIIKHREMRFPNKIECLETVLNECYGLMAKETNDFAKSFLDLQNNVKNMQHTTNDTLARLDNVKERIIKIVEQFFNSLKNDVQNKQKKNQENQARDAELLQKLVQYILYQVEERWSSHILFLETLNSQASMTSLIQYFGTSLLDDNATYFEVLNEYSNRFEQVSSDIIFLQDRGYQYTQTRIEIAAHLSQIVKIRHNEVHEFVQIHSLPNPNIKDATSLQPKPQTRAIPSVPLYPSLRASPFIPPQQVTTGVTRLLENGTYYNDKRYTDSLNKLPQYSMR